MRVNVYAEELTHRVEIISKEIDGKNFTGVRFYLYLPVTKDGQQIQGPFLHREDDDDSAAVTFWGKQDLRVLLWKAIELLDGHYAQARSIPKTSIPSYYPKDHEPMEVIESWGLGFKLGNVVKYVARAGKKGDKKEDLEKARVYLEREIASL